MANKEIAAKIILEHFGDVAERVEGSDCEYMVKPEGLLPVCRALLTAGFEFLADITAVDYIDREVFRLLYQICNYENGDTVTLKVEIPRAEPVVESMCAVWASANWLEREVYDMFGIVFANHPRMERILMWEGFEGWPLRKDFVHQPTKYQGRRRLD
jgi:NADH/F420H2 dehydrogenase subunit C